MYIFRGSPEMALTLAALRKDRERGKSGLTRQRSGFALFIACLRHNRENRRNGEE
jgi:hypothetical protein